MSFSEVPNAGSSAALETFISYSSPSPVASTLAAPTGPVEPLMPKTMTSGGNCGVVAAQSAIANTSQALGNEADKETEDLFRFMKGHILLIVLIVIVFGIFSVARGK